MLDMRPTQPPLAQPVWTIRCDHLQEKSHFRGYRERNWFPLYHDGLVNTSGYGVDQHYYQQPLSQQLLCQTMDNQSLSLYQHGMDSGDEACPLNDYFAENFPLVGTGLQNVRSQTTAQSVSLASCGRDQVPSHPQYSNKAVPGNEQVFFPVYPQANAYTRDLAGSLNQQPYQYPASAYNPNGLCNPNLDLEFEHRLPSPTEVYSSMPVFAEPFDYGHVPPTLNSSFTSSVGSSTASERMASMTLESVPPQGRPSAMGYRSDRHGATNSIQGQGWVGSCPATISPKMLRINPSPTPMSSSESIQQTGIQVTCGDSDIGPSAWDQQQVRPVLPLKRSNHKSRKELPTKPSKPRVVPSSPRESASSRAKGKEHANKHSHHSLRHQPELTPERLIAKEHLAESGEDYLDGVPSGSADPERDAKNRFLVQSKLAGMTYREIRRQGNFTEAESTLRGRFRTLTKNKDQRVRKPEWQDKDIRLLKKAVRKLSKGDGAAPGKVPWKQVATYIYEHDGSYHFGNATCRKKWDELVEQGATGMP